MKVTLYLFFICLFICSSCENKNVSAYNFTKNQRQWIKPNLWINDLNELYNFPYWFDDSLISKNNIHTIQQKEYTTTYTHFSMDKLINIPPDKITTYAFDLHGKIKSLKIQLFNDGVNYSTKEFNYTSSVDEKILFSDYSIRFESLQSVKNETSKKVYLESQTPNYMAYIDSMNTQRIYFITNLQLTSPISIDTMLQANPNDILIIPNLIYPVKIYSVANKILESNVHEFQYDTYKNLIQYSHRQSSSKKEITLNYSKDGYLNGFVGKIFSDNFLITEFKQKVKTGKDGRPLKIYENTSKPSLKRVILFVYD